MTEQATSVPVDPTESGSESESELTPLSIEGRIARTDAHLLDWRTESVRRREAWDRAQEEERAEAVQRRRRLMVPVIGVTSAVALVLAVTVALWALWPRAAEVAEVAASPVAVVAEPVVVEPVVEPIPEPVVEPVVEEEPVAVVEEPVAAPEPPPAVPVLADTVELWRDDAHHWVRFTIGTDAPAWMAWRDATGARVLEDMGCAAPGAAGHVCKAGRSHYRIRSALKAGAVPGDWTVEVCTTAGCTTVGTFAVP